MYQVSLLSIMANNGGKTNTCGFEFLTNQSSVGEEWRCEARVSNPVYEVSLLSMNWPPEELAHY